MTLALDGSGAAGETGSSVGSIPTNFGNLTTSSANDVVFADVLICVGNAAGAYTTVTGVSATGVTGWTKQNQVQYHGGYATAYVNHERWYGIAAAALSNIAITATFSASNCDCASMICGAISGANTATPFDVNANASKQGSDTGTSAPSTAGQSTTNPNCFLLSSYCSAHNDNETGATFGAAAGSTPGVLPNALGTNLWAYLGSSGLVVSAAQTNITDTYTPNSAQGWGMLVDAIQQAGGAAAKSAPPFITGSRLRFMPRLHRGIEHESNIRCSISGHSHSRWRKRGSLFYPASGQQAVRPDRLHLGSSL